jgi:hypothetical protein
MNTIARFGRPPWWITARVLVFAALALLPAAAQTSLAPVSDGSDPILSKTRAFVQQFAEEFSYLRYDEDVVEAKLKNNDSEKVAYQQEMMFDSMLRMQFEGGKLRVDEQRILQRSRHLESRPLLNTYGFSTLTMVFHPYYESSFQFSRAGNDVLQGRALARIDFNHIPGAPTPILYQMFGPDRPLEISGAAWVDAATGEIYRMEATIAPVISDMGVKSIRAAVEFKPVLLEEETTPRVLPVRATIDLETPRQHWRNVHRFSEYRKYRVTTNMPGVTQ